MSQTWKDPEKRGQAEQTYFGTIVIDTTDGNYTSYLNHSYKWDLDHLIYNIRRRKGKYTISVMRSKIISIHLEEKI